MQQSVLAPDSGRNGIPPTTLQQTPYRDIMAAATHLSEFELVAEL
jgi:hypothetical protein